MRCWLSSLWGILVIASFSGLASSACAAPTQAGGPAQQAPRVQRASVVHGPRGRDAVERMKEHSRVLPAGLVVQPGFEDPKRSQRIVEAFNAERSWFEQRLVELHTPGVAWGLVVDDTLAVGGVSGMTSVSVGHPVTLDTAFRLGSVTKVFTASAVLALRDEGRVSLDEPAESYLSELRGVTYPTEDSPLITLRHLLTHTSGLPRLGSFAYWTQSPPDEPTVLASLQNLALQSVPGTDYSYSNLGVALLGPLIARVSGTSYRGWLQDRLLLPLGMTSTHWAPEDYSEGQLARPHHEEDGELAPIPEWRQGAAAAAGGLYSTLRDMAKWAAFQLSAWPASNRSETLSLRRASVRESHLQHWLIGSELEWKGADSPTNLLTSGVGIGWQTYRDCRFDHVVWHNGESEGHSAALYLLPRRGVAVILLTNRADTDLDSLAKDLLSRLYDAGALPARKQAPLAVVVRRARDAIAMGEDFDEAAYEALFDEGFRRIIPFAQAGALFQYVHETLGDCTLGGAVTPSRLNRSVLQVDCGQFQAFVDVEVNLTPPYRIRMFRMLDGRRPAHRARLSRMQTKARCEPAPSRNSDAPTPAPSPSGVGEPAPHGSGSRNQAR